jgi:hypothetical protein
VATWENASAAVEEVARQNDLPAVVMANALELCRFDNGRWTAPEAVARGHSPTIDLGFGGSPEGAFDIEIFADRYEVNFNEKPHVDIREFQLSPEHGLPRKLVRLLDQLLGH